MYTRKSLQQFDEANACKDFRLHKLVQTFIFYVVKKDRLQYGIHKLSRKLGKMDDRQVPSLKRENFADSVKMWPSTAGRRCAGMTNFAGFTEMFKIGS
jgi:hypothetical protein